jgi:HD-GYP domain-containing protein (c-di-GMP phosphodiesterase class II)
MSSRHWPTATLRPCASAGFRHPLVRKLAVRLSRELGLGEEEQVLADVRAQVRDIGTIALPDAVILKTGPLSPRDWAQLNRHPELGAELLKSFPTLGSAAALVRAHHERWDGDGYPRGLRGDAIPLPSRIVAVCDAFVAIATDRPHRRGIGTDHPEASRRRPARRGDRSGSPSDREHRSHPSP